MIGVAAPYAAFSDSPEARAIRGALWLDTLVVAPAGNDGPAGPGYGSIASPGGASDALTAGAADLRSQAEEVPVAVRTGIDLLLDRRLPLAGAVTSSRPMELTLVAPRTAPDAEPQLSDFFDGHGVSTVAGHAALIRVGRDPRLAIEDAAAAGARAVVLYGIQLPAGGLGLDESVDVPVVSLPDGVGRAAVAALAAGHKPVLSVGVPDTVHNGTSAEIAPFSSRGLAFDGRVKPDVAAPGVVLATAEPGSNDDGSPRYGTVNGSSAAAAIVSGAAALLAEARPGLGAADLRSLLTATAHPLGDTSVTAQGGGLIDVGAAAATELAAQPDTLAFGRAEGDGWHRSQPLTLHNVSTRRFLVRIRSVGQGGLEIDPHPRWVRLKPDGTLTVRLEARLRGAPPAAGSAEGAILLMPRGGAPIRVPWAILFGRPPRELLSQVALSASSFRPSDIPPAAVLSLRAGSLAQDPTGAEVHPVGRLDVLLYRGKDKLGLLARLRDLLPGQVAIGITGRDPDGKLLPRGRYEIRLVAVPTSGGPGTTRTISFRVK
jgi:hypothetical protein